LITLILSSGVGVWYLMKKHWIANNLFGLAFAVNGVELLHLNNVMTGCILLCGLFLYDIFWVFGTDVMVTVAKSFEAPIKLVFPQDLIEHGFGATNMAMLGLGDIVIPGIFVALLLRYDQSLKRNSNFYFYVTFIAYILGLLTTIGVMHVYKHAQPALLYLVPACLGTPLFLLLRHFYRIHSWTFDHHRCNACLQTRTTRAFIFGTSLLRNSLVFCTCAGRYQINVPVR